ncbi:hypothetical protein FBU30_010105 [Linnemannia zychae]|nr:hypothetical protein FBU30_010105 [Linnemannia zychae]
MTHYQRTPMPPMPSGMPIIPPRLQQQQQHELLMNNRRQQQQQQHYQQQQPRPFPPTQNPKPMLFPGHSRSVSNGSVPSRHPRPLNGPPLSHGSNHHPTYPDNTGNNPHIYSNNNSNNSGYRGNYQQGPGGRLRSESNPSYSSSRNNYGSPSTDAYTGPTRANSSGPASSSSSFQNRLKERDRERQNRERDEREAAARAIREDPKLNVLINSAETPKEAPIAPAHGTGTALWNRLRAAKDVINATITGEERWPDSDDSDYEGESHVSRVLQDYADKKEAKELAARINELERMPISPLSANGSTGSSYSGRSRTLRDAIRQGHEHGSGSSAPTTLASPASSSDYLGRSRRAKGETGHQTSRSEDSSVPFRPIRTRDLVPKQPAPAPASHGLSPPASPATPTSTTPSSDKAETPWIGNRFRTSSDPSLSAALGRLEGKRNQDALIAQVSHLGSTRARSPHRGNRAYRDHIDVVPPPPLPTPKNDYHPQPLLPSSSSSMNSMNPLARRNGSLNQHQPVADRDGISAKNALGAYGQRQQRQQQQQQGLYF